MTDEQKTQALCKYVRDNHNVDILDLPVNCIKTTRFAGAFESPSRLLDGWVLWSNTPQRGSFWCAIYDELCGKSWNDIYNPLHHLIYKDPRRLP